MGLRIAESWPHRCSQRLSRAVFEPDAVQLAQPLAAALVAASGEAEGAMVRPSAKSV
jgi:hypothetical protein